MASAGEPAGSWRVQSATHSHATSDLTWPVRCEDIALEFARTAKERTEAPLKGVGLCRAIQKNSKNSLFVNGSLVYIPRMENDPSDQTRRVLGITTDTWMLIGQLAALLALAAALVGLQSLL